MTAFANSVGRRLRFWRAPFTGALATALLVIAAPGSAEPPVTVVWKAHRLSGVAEGTPLARVLREVARRTGVEILGADELMEPTSARFSELPLAEGLRRLLASVDSILVEAHAPTGRLEPVSVRIFRPSRGHEGRVPRREERGSDPPANTLDEIEGEPAAEYEDEVPAVYEGPDDA